MAEDETSKHVLDRASLLVLRRSARATLVTKSPVAHVLILSVSDALKATVLRTYPGEIDGRGLEGHLATTQLLPRTVWMNEICHRYLFERAVCAKRDNDATRFLETEIVKEVFFLCRARGTARDRSSMVERETPLVERALGAIEARLFDEDVVAGLARACGASASTLLRAFQRELGQSPLAYVRARRLDESLLLLKSRRFAVSEVATKVGYKSFAAFSQAFRARFGESPSEIRARRRASM